jgi:hypothetical protein
VLADLTLRQRHFTIGYAEIADRPELDAIDESTAGNFAQADPVFHRCRRSLNPRELWISVQDYTI